MKPICYICRKSDQNEVEYGEFLSRAGVSVHYFCLLFSNDLVQRGRTDSSGIGRFFLRDIKDLYKQTIRDQCTYCCEYNATVRCSDERCNAKFHFICAVRANCLPRFVDPYTTYCSNHHPAAIVGQPAVDYAQLPVELHSCVICLERLPALFSMALVVPSCCGRGWFHSNCLRKFALAAGYYLGCLMCRSKDWRQIVRLMGVYVPDREAQWESRHDEQVRMLQQRHRQCDMAECQCKQGREHRGQTDAWNLWLCTVCAAYGAHGRCAQQAARDTWSDIAEADSAAASAAELTKFVCPPCQGIMCKQRISSLEAAVDERWQTLAERTLADDDDELNYAREFGENETFCEDLSDAAAISSDGVTTIHDSETYSKSYNLDAEAHEPLSPRSSLTKDWLYKLGIEHTSRERLKFRLRLLLGQTFPLDQRIRLNRD